MLGYLLSWGLPIATAFFAGRLSQSQKERDWVVEKTEPVRTFIGGVCHQVFEFVKQKAETKEDPESVLTPFFVFVFTWLNKLPSCPLFPSVANKKIELGKLPVNKSTDDVNPQASSSSSSSFSKSDTTTSSSSCPSSSVHTGSSHHAHGS